MIYFSGKNLFNINPYERNPRKLMVYHIDLTFGFLNGRNSRRKCSQKAALKKHTCV